MSEWIVVGDEALTVDEYEALRRRREQDNVRRRLPGYRERQRRYMQAWRDANREHCRAWNREYMRERRAAERAGLPIPRRRAA